MTISNELKMFAAGNTEFYEAALSYFCDKKQSIENKSLMNDAFFAEVERKAGIKRSDAELGAWIQHPSVRWAAMSIVDQTVNAIIPVTILPQFNMFADFRTQGIGDTTKFTVRPNQLYVVSKGAKGERTSVRQRHFSKEVFLTPVEHIVTIYENLYNVLAGRTDVADFIGWVVLSVETEMYKDALGVFTTGITAQSAPWSKTGAFSLAELLKLCELVQAKNNGIKPIIAGSATALMNVLPDSTAGYRVNLDGKDAGIELIKGVFGYSVLRLDNAIDANDALVLPTDKIFVIAPAADKLVKGVMTSSMTNGNDAFMNADITKDFTYRKEWAFTYLASAKGAVYTIV